jgi:hypothetical protein
MTTEKLEMANNLKSYINDCDRSLNCFSFTHEGKDISLNPELIIECDGEDEFGRYQMKLPFDLNETLIGWLKNHIKEQREIAIAQFISL